MSNYKPPFDTVLKIVDELRNDAFTSEQYELGAKYRQLEYAFKDIIIEQISHSPVFHLEDWPKYNTEGSVNRYKAGDWVFMDSPYIDEGVKRYRIDHLRKNHSNEYFYIMDIPKRTPDEDQDSADVSFAEEDLFHSEEEALKSIKI